MQNSKVHNRNSNKAFYYKQHTISTKEVTLTKFWKSMLSSNTFITTIFHIVSKNAYPFMPVSVKDHQLQVLFKYI